MPYLSIDTETYPITRGQLVPRLVVLSTFLPSRDEATLVPHASAGERLHGWLRSGGSVVGHNIAYDLAVLARRWDESGGGKSPVNGRSLLEEVFRAYEDGRVHCTKIREQLIQIALGAGGDVESGGAKQRDFSLAECMRRRFNVDLSADKKSPDAWRLRYHELEHLPHAEWPEDARRYALEDARHAWRLFEAQQSEAELLRDEAAQARAAWMLHLAAAWGIRTDPQAVGELGVNLERQYRQLEGELKDAGVIREAGTKDTAAIKRRVEEAYARKGLTVPTTPSGATSTARETLDESGDPVLQKLGRLSAVEKLRGTFLPVLMGGTERPINPRWNTLVSSGRTSCSSPNLQNLPREGGVRECFVPRRGYVFAQADYGILELRALAQVLLAMFGKSAMAEALQAGRELHLEMAARLLGIPYEEAVARKKEPEVKEARQLAKAANFGFPGGLGATAMQGYAKAAYQVTMSEQEARDLRAAWLKAYPEMEQYFRHVAQLVERNGGGYQQEAVGSRRLRGDCGFTDGCNGYFQSLAADGAKAAGWLITKECYTVPSSPLFGARVVAFVHDEYLLEVPEEKAPEAAERLAALMVEGMRRYIPDIPIIAEPLLMRRWFKDAEPVRDAAGRLVPWTPKA